MNALRSVGRYELLEVIGRGGAAVVYLAHQSDLRRRVALKELAPFQAAADPSFAGRFAEESRVAGSLSHPNIVTVHEYFEHDGVPYIAMEYLPQGSLRRYIGSLTPAQIAGVLEGVLAGLAHGQSRSVVHRDLKPENLLVTGDGRVKIADFGVARAYADAMTRPVVTAQGTTIGTPAYMAPEQALGHEVGPPADLYSLGIVAWEMLAGRVPFLEKDTPVAVLYKHVHEPIPPVRSVAPDIDPRIEAWLERMLAKQPGDRFPDAGTSWEALEDVVLELLGPRWRRDARLDVIETAAAGQPLTPAVFGYAAPAADAGDPRQAQPTLDGTPAPPAAPAPAAAAAPSSIPIAPAGDHTTIHRLARRHDLEAPAEAAPSPSSRSRLGLAVAVVVAAAVVAGVVGAAVGNAGPKRPPLRRAVTNQAPARAATAVVGVVRGVVMARDRELGQLNAARTPAARADAAAAVAATYARGASQLSGLPAAAAQASQTRAISATLTALAGDYRELSAAASARSPARDAAARGLIGAAEVRLRSEVDALS